jgi:hypothetical protein
MMQTSPTSAGDADEAHTARETQLATGKKETCGRTPRAAKILDRDDPYRLSPHRSVRRLLQRTLTDLIYEHSIET